MKALFVVAILCLVAILASAWLELDWRHSRADADEFMPRPPVTITGRMMELTPAGFVPLDTTGVVLQVRGMLYGQPHSFDATLDVCGNVVWVVPMEGTDPLDITEYPCEIVEGCMR